MLAPPKYSGAPPYKLQQSSPSYRSNWVLMEDPHNDMSRLFLPPVNRAMKTLDRSFFHRTIPLSAVLVKDQKKISAIKKLCENDLLKYKGVVSVKPVMLKEEGGTKTVIPMDKQEAASVIKESCVKETEVQKLIPLHPRVKHDVPETIPLPLRQCMETNDIKLVPFELNLEYSNWGYDEIIHSILPEDLLDEIPSGFTQVGHIAHINLREQYLPYKYIIGQLLLDKNPKIKTVLNKVDEVGVTSEYRTFNMEILAGESNTQVEQSENECRFRFDFAKVYWNSRLSTEHNRIIELFKPGEAVADVMAGVGPFAVPAGKKRVFVWANDLNPESYKSLKENIHLNKVENFVKPQNEDGRDFIKNSVKELYRFSRSKWGSVTVQPKIKHSKSGSVTPQSIPRPEVIPCPPTFSHFVMNLPASAVEFLDAFIGVYAGMEELFEPQGKAKLPQIHLHIFQRPTDDAYDQICQRISKYLNYPIIREDVTFTDVRLVAPNKMMYCANFELPREVAFAGIEGKKGMEKEEISSFQEVAWLG